MLKGMRYILLLPMLFMMVSVACNFGLDLPFVGSPDEGISAEDVSLAATRAAEAAATAAAAAGDAGQLAATAVAESNLAATADAVATAGASAAQSALESTTAATSLQQKLANIQPDANGNFSVTITEADLNDFISQQEGAFQTNTLSAQSIQFDLTPDYLELTGDVTEPVALPLVVQLRPIISSGQLQFELVSATAGILPVPESMLDLIESVANSELSRALLGLPSGVTMQNVTLADGEFTLFGHQN